MTRRKTLLLLGKRGRRVRVAEAMIRGAIVLRVTWRDLEGKRRAALYARSQRAEAVQFAEGIAFELSRPAPDARPQSLTVAALWDRYSEAVFPSLRPKSKVLYRYFWKRFEAFAGAHTTAEDLTIETMNGLRRALEAQGAAVNTIRRVMAVTRMVFLYGETHELIAKNRVGRYVYRVAKEARPTAPAEYRMPEFRALLAQFDPTKASQWRPAVALALCGYQGARQNAVLHLRWEDVDLEAGRITWRAAWDKVGREWSQPLRAPSRAALEAAARFRDDCGWVFWGRNRATGEAQPYTIQSLWAALRQAERRAGIPHADRRGGHGLRRLLAGEVAGLTGDSKLALNAIGDSDIRQAERYIKVRDDRLAEVFGDLDANREGV